MSQKYKKLLQYFLALLARRDYSRFQLTQKAELGGYDQETINSCLDQLEASKYLDDTRLVQAIINSYQGSKGRLWLVKKFQSLGIKEESWEPFLEDYSDLPSSKLLQSLIRKYDLKPENLQDFKLKTKVRSFLEYRGYVNFSEIWLEILKQIDKSKK